MRIIITAGTVVTVACLGVMLLSSPVSTQEAVPSAFDPSGAFHLSAADLVTAIARTKRDNENAVFVDHPNAYRLAVEYRRPPQRAASHATEAELWVVMDGSATVVTGGTIVDGQLAPNSTNTFGPAIEGGTSQQVNKGDFLLVPEGVPHMITDASPDITFVSFEIPRPAATQD